MLHDPTHCIQLEEAGMTKDGKKKNEYAKKAGDTLRVFGTAILIGILEGVTQEIQQRAIRGGTKIVLNLLKKTADYVLKNTERTD